MNGFINFHNTFVLCLQHKLSQPGHNKNANHNELLVNKNIQRDNQFFKNNYIPTQSYELKCLSSLKVGDDTY